MSDTEVSSVAPDHREHGWQRRERERRETAVRFMSLQEQMVAHLGGIFSAAIAPPKNDLLMSGRVAIPESGLWTRSWKQPFASVEVDAGAATGPVFVAGGAPPTHQPTLTNWLGPNNFALAKGEWRVLNMRDSELTVLANPGDVLEITVYARPRQPGSIDSSVPEPVVAAVANPALGADWSWTSPSYPVMVQSAFSQLVTDAVVLNRFVHLVMTLADGATLFKGNPYVAITASTTAWFSLGLGVFRATSAAGAQDSAPEIWLPPGTVVGSQTNLDPGDQWENVVLSYVAGPC